MSWKLFGVLDIGFVNKYRTNLFFRTEFNIITLQVIFALLLLGLFGVALHYLYEDVAQTIIQGVMDSLLANPTPVDASVIIQNLEYVRTRSLVIVVTLLVMSTIIFGYIVARVTLRPTRDALSSQKRFIGNIAHELRTPLAVIRTTTEVNLLDTSLDEALAKDLRSNIDELDRISDIINNLLSLNTIMKSEPLRFETIDMKDIITHICSKKLHKLSERRSITLVLQTPPGCMLQGNRSALEQIATNIIKNAIAYSQPGGTVEISTVSNEKTIDIIVKDNGIGISQKDLFHVLEPFYRADESRARREGGSGLGLAIVNELVKMHNGTLDIQSTLGVGTVVTTSFPCVG